jgi:hypothetical protein
VSETEDAQRVVKVSCGAYHSIAITDQGNLYTWGSGKFGQLGHASGGGSPESTRQSSRRSSYEENEGGDEKDGGHFQDSWSPKVVTAFTDSLGDGHGGGGGLGLVVVDASAGAGHTAVVALSSKAQSDGMVFTFGYNSHGRLGHGASSSDHTHHTPLKVKRNVAVPTQVMLPGGGANDSGGGPPLLAQRVDCGINCTAALTSDGRVFTCGRFQDGALGPGGPAEGKDENVPTLVEGLEGHRIVHISMSHTTAMAVADDSKVFVWGSSSPAGGRPSRGGAVWGDSSPGSRSISSQNRHHIPHLVSPTGVTEMLSGGAAYGGHLQSRAVQMSLGAGMAGHSDLISSEMMTMHPSTTVTTTEGNSTRRVNVSKAEWDSMTQKVVELDGLRRDIEALKAAAHANNRSSVI